MEELQRYPDRSLQLLDTELITLTIPTIDYIDRFNRRAIFEPLCRQCGNWASRWGCPPFDFDPMARIKRFGKTTIYFITAKVNKWPENAGIPEMTEAIQSIRRQYEPKLLDIEQELNGFAALFTGQCFHCGSLPCTRLNNKPCRHPQKVRPSLEALGFDLGATASDLFHSPLQWFDPQKPHPTHLSIIAAIFHN